jgi:hypothetical protein
MAKTGFAGVAAAEFSFEHVAGLDGPLKVVDIVDGAQLLEVESQIYYGLDELREEPTYRYWDSLRDVLQADTTLLVRNASAKIRPEGRMKVGADWEAELHTNGYGHIATASLGKVLYLVKRSREEEEAEVVRRFSSGQRIPILTPGSEFDGWQHKTPDKYLVDQLNNRFSRDAKR